MLVANHAHREGWQGGTGWHETGELCATPCFLELMEALHKKFQALKRRNRRPARSVRALWRAMACKLGHSCAFCPQRRGGNAHERTPVRSPVLCGAMPSPQIGRAGALSGLILAVLGTLCASCIVPGASIPRKTRGGNTDASSVPLFASLPPQTPCSP